MCQSCPMRSFHVLALQRSATVIDSVPFVLTLKNKICSCRQKNACPLDRNCLQPNLQPSITFQTTVTRKDSKTTQNLHRTHGKRLQNQIQKPDPETTPHLSATLNTETLPNSANTYGPLKTTTLNTLFPGASCHHTRQITAQAEDVTSASKKNSYSSVDRNYPR